jgi:formate dehydrogenase accessory protein FdhD
MKKVRVWKGGKESTALVAEERELTIRVDGEDIATLMLSPGYEEECVTGFLVGEGLVTGLQDILALHVSGSEAKVKTRRGLISRCRPYLSSDCVGGWRTRVQERGTKVESSFKVGAEEISENMKRLQGGSKIWKKTGGVHSAVLVFGEDFTVIEDISRHVSLDKVIGRGLIKGADFSSSYILTTGRLPGDMVVKAARVGIPIMVSRAAPLLSGIQWAEEAGVTLVGFARGRSMNIYTFPDRINFL